MERAARDRSRCFRVWIAAWPAGREIAWPAACDAAWSDLPPEPALAVQPAEEGVLSESEARCYVHGYNQAALQQATGLWALAVPVTIRYEGDAQAGTRITGHAFAPEVAESGRVSEGGKQ